MSNCQYVFVLLIVAPHVRPWVPGVYGSVSLESQVKRLPKTFFQACWVAAASSTLRSSIQQSWSIKWPESQRVLLFVSSPSTPKLCTHTVHHRLNLCVMKCCSIGEVINMMKTADKISWFFSNSPERQLALEEWIDSALPGENRKKVKKLCRTWWVECHEAFEVFLESFLPTFSCLEAIF